VIQGINHVARPLPEPKGEKHFSCITVKRVTYRAEKSWRSLVRPSKYAVFTAPLQALAEDLVLLPLGRFCAVEQLKSRLAGWRLDAQLASSIIKESNSLRGLEMLVRDKDDALEITSFAGLGFSSERGIVAAGVQWSEATRSLLSIHSELQVAVLLDIHPAHERPVRLASVSVLADVQEVIAGSLTRLAHFAERISPALEPHLPRSALALVSLLGWHGAANLINQFGGRKFPVPKAAGNNRGGSIRYAQLVAAIGETGAARLVAEIGGETLTVPNCTRALERAALVTRDQTLRARYEQGATFESLVREFGLSSRRISHLLKRQVTEGPPPCIRSPNDSLIPTRPTASPPFQWSNAT
jgi:hypothetical protein